MHHSAQTHFYSVLRNSCAEISESFIYIHCLKIHFKKKPVNFLRNYCCMFDHILNEMNNATQPNRSNSRMKSVKMIQIHYQVFVQRMPTIVTRQKNLESNASSSSILYIRSVKEICHRHLLTSKCCDLPKQLTVKHES